MAKWLWLLIPSRLVSYNPQKNPGSGKSKKINFRRNYWVQKEEHQNI